MGKRKQHSGLIKRSGIWHIDKQINGRRICKTTGATDRREAEQILKREIQRLNDRIRLPKKSRTFGEAAVKWAEDNQDRKSIARDVQDLKQVLPFLGESPLKQVHQLTLEPFFKKRKSEGIASSTVKRTVSTVSRVLQYAHRVYRDELGEPWLDVLPSFKVPEWSKARERYCLSLDEVTCLETALSAELRLIMHFLLNTGLRDAELRNLRWDMEEEPVDGCLVFLLPGTLVKNVTDRLVFCNAIASRIVNEQRTLGSEWVFPVKGKMRESRIGSSGWRDGRKRAARLFQDMHPSGPSNGFKRVRVHDLRHTFGDRLRSQGINLDTCGDLLGHKGRGVTAHYCRAQSPELIAAVRTLERFEVPQKSRTHNILDFPNIGKPIAY